MRQILFLMAFALLLPAKANLHKYYVSMSEVAYNSESQKVEVGIKLFFDDLQQAIMVEQNEAITDPLSDYEKQITKYIMNHFSVKNGAGEQLKFDFVGMEDEIDAVWIYYESNEVAFTKDWTVKNTIFLDLYENQVNMVNFYADKYDMSVVEGLMLNSQEKEGQIHFD